MEIRKQLENELLAIKEVLRQLDGGYSEMSEEEYISTIVMVSELEKRKTLLECILENYKAGK